MNGICKFLDYTLVEDPELLDIFGAGDGQFLITDYKCQHKKRKMGICPQVVENVEKSGFGIVNPEEMENCPYHPKNKSLSE